MRTAGAHSCKSLAPTRRDMPRGWTALLLMLGSWAALISSALLVHAIVMGGLLP